MCVTEGGGGGVGGGGEILKQQQQITRAWMERYLCRVAEGHLVWCSVLSRYHTSSFCSHCTYHTADWLLSGQPFPARQCETETELVTGVLTSGKPHEVASG